MNENLSRRNFLKAIGFGTASLALPGCADVGEPLAKDGIEDKPNIIFIMADDLGYGDLGCYGATKVQTPNIDRIAKQGIRFTDAHTPSSVCTPTRYGVLTGRYCWRKGLKIRGNPNAPLRIERDRLTAASLLKSAGYRTGCVGKWHLGFGEKRPDWDGELKPGPLEVGFDYYFGVPVSRNWPPFVYVENHHVVGLKKGEVIDAKGISAIWPSPVKRRDDEIGLVQTDKAVKFIEHNRNRPFFLYFATCSVHEPHTPNNRFRGTSQCGYYGDSIHELDWTVGQVLKTLKRLNLSDKTLIILTSDNGAVTDFRPALPMYGTGMNFGHRPCGSLRGQKCDVYEGGHRVPFIASWPGKIKAGTTSDEIICLTDLIATCAAIVGVNIPENTGEDSYNILPALLDQKVDRPIREAVVHHSGYGMFSIRQGPWKLILGRGSGGFTEPGGFEPKASEPKGQLYNLKQDLGETNNLWAQHPEIVQRLSKLLEKYKQQGYSRSVR